MHRASEKERMEFRVLISNHLPPTRSWGECINFADTIMRYGATYARIQEFDCGSPDARYGQDEYNARMQRLWEREQERLQAKEERLVKRIESLCASMGCKAILSGDPRGSTIKIKVPDGYTNDWGKEGICVPTS